MHKRFFAGFTVAELLIVIVVIGIIAGIAMISYRGVQLRGHDTAVQDNLSKIAEGYNNYFTDNNVYPPADSTLSTAKVQVNRASYDNTATSGAMVYCTNAARSEYVLLARSKSGKAYYVVSEGPVKSFTGTYPVTTGSPTVASACDPLLGSATASFAWINSGGTTSGTWNYSY
jgi:prepilin-type N-terminal cleavage/methylation domain-containing protein